MKRALQRVSPSSYAIIYGVVISAAAAASSHLQGTLIHEGLIQIGTHKYVQHPYVTNISTILDFGILNPIAIYFLLQARAGFETAYAHFKAGRQISLFDQFGLLAVSLTVGIGAMWFYYHGFIGGTFFTEAFEPTQRGTASISVTGWVIFFGTSLFITLVAYVTVEFANYMLFVGRLGPGEFRFAIPPAVSPDIKIAIAPCISVAYVLATLFFVFVVFVFRDFFQFSISSSWRAWLFGPYVLVCLVAFLPFWRLHRMMAQQRHRLIDANNRVIEEEICGREGKDKANTPDPERLIGSVEKIEKLQSFYKSIPVWPANPSDLVVPNLSVAFSLATFAYKAFDTIRAAIK